VPAQQSLSGIDDDRRNYHNRNMDVDLFFRTWCTFLPRYIETNGTDADHRPALSGLPDSIPLENPKGKNVQLESGKNNSTRTSPRAGQA